MGAIPDAALRNRYAEGQRRRHARERQIVTLTMQWRDADALRRLMEYELNVGNFTTVWRRRLSNILAAAVKATERTR